MSKKKKHLINVIALTLGLAFGVLSLATPLVEAAEQQSKKDDEVTPPRVFPKSQRRPVFPPAAKAARFQGEVVLRINVLPTGKPGSILVVQSSHPKVGFEEAAIAAAERWRFIPAMHRGVPVEYEAQYKVTFGRRGVGVAGTGDMGAINGRTHAANKLGAAPTTRPTNTGATTRTSPRRR